MLRCVKKFISDEAGAVTIEWVVLTAGVIALGIAGYSAFKIDMDSSTITVALELKMFRACNFSSGGA